MKVTLISWDNLGYISLVEKEMTQQGHEVTHINMVDYKYVYPNLFFKGVNAFSKVLFNYNFKRENLAKRIQQELDQLPRQDRIVIVSADWLPVSFLKIAKQKTNKLIGVFYDASSNYPRIPKVIPYFDQVFSFEKKDAINNKINFLPNFNPYNTPFQGIERKPFLYHVSSDRNNREVILTNIAKVFKTYKIDYKIILITGKTHSNPFITLSSKMIPLQEVYDNLENASFQIDIQRERQEGLSFRVFEAMGMQQKIITTNRDVVNYDFYNPNNILVIDEEQVEIPEQFLLTPYIPISEELYEKYTIRNWVQQVLEI